MLYKIKEFFFISQSYAILSFSVAPLHPTAVAILLAELLEPYSKHSTVK